MKKKLSEMTIEELWQLFPIILTEHNPSWADWYREEAEILKGMLPNAKYYHIGSTAINGICAKPIIDILIVVDDCLHMKQAARLLEDNGYIIMNSSDKRISLNKGYTENGFAEKVFHLHIRVSGDTDEIYFRDYLNENPYEHDRDAYTLAKTEFVKRYTALAKQNLT